MIDEKRNPEESQNAQPNHECPHEEVKGYPCKPFGHVPDDYLPAEATHPAGSGCSDEPFQSDDEKGSHHGSHHNQELGKRGEDAAVRFLKRKGFTILERNWQCIAGEADIIAMLETEWEREIHFIEVKTRTSTCTGFPEEAVNEAKRKRYERISEIYFCEHDTGEARVMLDIISLLVTGPHSAYMRFHSNVLVRDC